MVDWRDQWQGIVHTVGTDFSDGQVQYGAETVERSTIRRYLEPLEFDCPSIKKLTSPRRTAYPDSIGRYTAIARGASRPCGSRARRQCLRTAGTTPGRIGLRTGRPHPRHWHRQWAISPPRCRSTSSARSRWATEWGGGVLAAGRLAEGDVSGRGAFLTWGTEIVDAGGDLVMRLRTGTYAYEPHPPTRSRPPTASGDRDPTVPGRVPVASASGGPDVERRVGDVR